MLNGGFTSFVIIVVAIVISIVILMIWYAIIKNAVKDGIYEALVKFQSYKDVLEGKVNITSDDDEE